MPLDPAWPPRRLQQLCDEGRPVAVLWAAPGAPGGHGPPPLVGGGPLVELPALAALLQTAAAAGAAQLLPAPAPASGSTCYLLYTSGSTGRALGVCGTQQGVLNRCRWMQAAFPFQPGDCVALKTAPAFVDSVWEALGPLLAGVPLVAAPQPRDAAQVGRERLAGSVL